MKLNLLFDILQPLRQEGVLSRAISKSPAEKSVGFFVLLIIFFLLVMGMRSIQSNSEKPRQQWRGFLFRYGKTKKPRVTNSRGF